MGIATRNGLPPRTRRINDAACVIIGGLEMPLTSGTKLGPYEIQSALEPGEWARYIAPGTRA